MPETKTNVLKNAHDEMRIDTLRLSVYLAICQVALS